MTELEADTQQAAPFSRRESGGEWGEVILSLTDGTPLGHPHRGGGFQIHTPTFQRRGGEQNYWVLLAEK